MPFSIPFYTGAPGRKSPEKNTATSRNAHRNPHRNRSSTVYCSLAPPGNSPWVALQLDSQTCSAHAT